MQPIFHLPSSKPLHPQNSRQQISRQSSAISKRTLFYQKTSLLKVSDSRQPTTNMLKVNSRSAIGGLSKRR